ncbi:MAG TPA: sulfite exporter TauE/SafE family protein [Burkholderiaceae bacterium]|nr:sulfite exporter TauE/SafE family protein [Burkholderiaceae bacterium]
MHFDFAIAFAGLLIGTIVGITGVGGGALMTPTLVMVFGVPPGIAVGTDLLYASATQLLGTAVHQRHGTVDWQVVGRLAMGSLPAAAATLWWMHASGHGNIQGGVIMFALGIALGITALGMIFKEKLHSFGTRLRVTDGEHFKSMQAGLTVASGVLLGVMVTLTSVGAGAIGTVLLVYLYPLRLTAGRLVGTGMAHAIPLTLIAGLGHLSLGDVDLSLMATLLAGSIPGVLVGSTISAKAPVKLVQRSIAGALLFASIRMLVR